MLDNMRKTNYIPHSLIKSIYPAINEQIGIQTTEEYVYFTNEDIVTDSNGIYGDFYKPNMTENEKIRFDNMMSDDAGCYMNCTKDKDNNLVLSLATVIHFLYVFGKFDIAETCTIGEKTVQYWGEEIATFEMSEKYKIPVFKFIEKYDWMTDKQDIFLDGLDHELDEEWRKKYPSMNEYGWVGMNLKKNF